MTEHDILKILKKYESIKPDYEYSQQSKGIILSSQQNKKALPLKTILSSMLNISELLRVSAIAGVAAFLLLFLMGGVSYINKTFSPLSLEGLSQKSLVTEAQDINNSIEITLEQIKYLDQSNQSAINTINQVSKNTPVYSTTTPETATSTADNATATSTDDIQKFLINASSTMPDSTNNLLDKLSQ